MADAMLEKLSEARCFGGLQQTWKHASRATGTGMRFSIFLPPRALDGTKVPVLWWLSGLTCTDENFTTKAGAQRMAAALGLVVVAPDTSPRGEGVPDDPQGAYDFGLGAGFYVDAAEQPWARHYRMETYVAEELRALVEGAFPVDPERQGISGHSMGGHGALTLALRRPGLWRSVSAFAPICAPSEVPWGRKALGGYLGPDEAAWRAHDACALIEDGARLPEILVDQGEADPFLADQLRPERLEAVCEAAGQPLTVRRRPGYDHSYFYVASFIDEHLTWHAERLAA